MTLNNYQYPKYLMRERSIIAVLKSAACEWVVIIVTLFNVVMSYLIANFARYNEVQLPCFFCSTIDHAFGNKKPGFNSKILCLKHKEELSSMVVCLVHDKIADSGGMCEECLLSNMKKNDSIMYRELLRKGGNTIGSHKYRNLLRNIDISFSSVGTRLCLCCKKPWILRNKYDKVRRFKPSKPNLPLPHCNRNKNNESKKHHRPFHGSITDVEYSGLRLTSDSESEFPFSDDDDIEHSTPLSNNESSSLGKLIPFNNDLSSKESNFLVATKPIKYEDMFQMSALELDSLTNCFNEKSANIMVSSIEKVSTDLVEKLRDDLKGVKKKMIILSEELENERNQARVLKGVIEEEKSQTRVLRGNLEDEKNQNKVLKEELDDEKSHTMVLRGELEEERDQRKLIKGELENERKRISSLLGELEEERNASATAANEAMAMITRLQEEKASLHMEALQYLRMMEEQAEYNVDALEKANDLLAEREKEIMEMEADIEAFQSKLSNPQIDIAEEEFNDGKMIIDNVLKEMEMKVKQLSSDLPSTSENNLEKRDEIEDKGREELNVLKNEVCDLRERVKGFESNWKVIKHAMKSLNYGEEGLQFVEEIACNLNELRKIGL